MIFLLLILFLILLFSGTGIVAAMGLPAVAYFIIKGQAINTVAYSFYQTLFSFGMVAIPMFTLMGNLVTEFGETERAFRYARAAVKGIKGYSSKIAIILNFVFAGMSGSSVTSVVGLGPMMCDEMDGEGYDRGYAASLTIAAATVGPVFPPSIPLLLYATVAGISTTQSLIAGVIPGIVLSGCLFIWVLLTHKRHFTHEPFVVFEETVPLKKLFIDALPILIAPFIIIYTMLSGLFSPGECGAMSAFYMIILSIIHRTFTWKKLIKCLKSTAVTCGSLLVLAVAGGTFTKALVMEGLGEALLALLGPLAHMPIVVLLIINLILLVMGMFMDSNSALLMITPVVLPITTMLGYNPLHIGVMIVLNLMIGLSTPPFGICLYAVSRAANVASERVIKNVIPLYVPLMAALALVTFIPAFSTWLPETIMAFLATK